MERIAVAHRAHRTSGTQSSRFGRLITRVAPRRPAALAAAFLCTSLVVAGVGTTVGAAGVTAAAAATKSANHPSASLPVFEPSKKSDWYALGDSYISGEGTFTYFSTSDGTTDYCHRSPDSYAIKLGVPKQNFLACSGATIHQIEHGRTGETPQVTRVSKSAALILLSAGGDSVGFVTVLKGCIDTSYDKCAGAVAHAETLMGGVKSQLVTLVKKLHNVAPKAWIMMISYPHLFPSNATSQCSLIRPRSQRLMNTAAAKLDKTVIRAAETELADDGLPVALATNLNTFEKNELCGGHLNPFYTNDLNGLTVLGTSGTLSDVSWHPLCHKIGTKILGVTLHLVCVESFHPTISGYTALKQVVATALDKLCLAHCATTPKPKPHSTHTTHNTPSPAPTQTQSAASPPCVASPCTAQGDGGEEISIVGVTTTTISTNTGSIDGGAAPVLAVTLWVENPEGNTDVEFGVPFTGTNVTLVDATHTTITYYEDNEPQLEINSVATEGDGRTCFAGTGSGYTVLPGQTITLPDDYCFGLGEIETVTFPILQISVDGALFTLNVPTVAPPTTTTTTVPTPPPPVTPTTPTTPTATTPGA